MTYLMIVTHRPPFFEYAHDFGASCASQEGVRPSQPKEMIALTEAQASALWDLLTLMWDHEPAARPRGTFIYDYLTYKLRHYRNDVPLDPRAMKLRRRTMSSAIPSKHSQFAVGSTISMEKSFGRPDGTLCRSTRIPMAVQTALLMCYIARARLLSMPAMPTLPPLVE
jgi:hypothetical protein